MQVGKIKKRKGKKKTLILRTCECITSHEKKRDCVYVIKIRPS